MGDMGDYWNDVKPILKEQSKQKRASNRESSLRMVERAGILVAANSDAHLTVKGNEGLIDFWPGTGLWIDRVTKKRGRGVMNLIKYCGRDGRADG